MSDEINEAFRRLARGERFAPQPPPTRDEAAALLAGDPPPAPTRNPHGSADGVARGAGTIAPDLNELIRDLALDSRG